MGPWRDSGVEAVIGRGPTGGDARGVGAVTVCVATVTARIDEVDARDDASTEIGMRAASAEMYAPSTS